MPQNLKRYIVDIDETICESLGDYPNARPLYDRIQKINDLYDAGNTIIYWTARGANSGKDWGNLTKSQLDEWGCKRHALWMNKPAYDIWVDDKAQWLF